MIIQDKDLDLAAKALIACVDGATENASKVTLTETQARKLVMVALYAIGARTADPGSLPPWNPLTPRDLPEILTDTHT